ncbi:FUSC family protein [Comamonas sp. Y33R10-2]|uniref:FUSC family protein n=1 Tax=Comamonas sp. Y33R10-2 TaxID=2853257 RepID=UPI001C5CAFCE|nr:FUSC family protein [Comamonas sp. Y33R10-2]QXZ09806.1 FUSC family protein [Comamonas sp. Y33R10-2]
MSVAAYDRLLENATRWGFDSARLRLHLRTAFAVCIAVFLAWVVGLQHPQWAGMTVWAASQPLRGQLLEKSFFRLFGTLIGTAAGVVLVLVANGDLLWLVTGLAIWIGVCAGLGNLQRSFTSYGTMLAGYSASMVALLDGGNPTFVYELGWDRLFTALTGVVVALIVGWLFTPVSAEIPGDDKVRRLCARLLRDIATASMAALKAASQAAAHGKGVLGPKDLAERLSAMAAIEEGLDLHAAGSTRSRRAVRALRRLINTQISALLWLRDCTGKTITPAFTAEQAQTIAQALEQAAHLLETQPAPLAAIDALASAQEAAAGWGHAQEILGNLGIALQAHFVAASDLPLPANHRARQFPVVLHSDWVGARRAMLRAFSAIFLVGLVWALTGWQGGAFMLLGLSIMVTVFSSFENPVFTMRFVIAGQAMGAGVALACQWFFWPFASSQLQMVLMMMPFILIGALLFSHHRTALSGFDCNMVILLALWPHFPYQLDYGNSLSMAFAIVTGPLAGWFAYHFILPVTVQGKIAGLRAMMVHELQDMAATPLHTLNVRVMRARLYHRLLRLVRTSEKISISAAQEAADCGLAALRVGKAVLILHALEEDRLLSESTLRGARSALQRLQQLPTAPAKAIPLLTGVAARIEQRQPEQALQLQLAAQDIGEHQRFFASTAKIA